MLYPSIPVFGFLLFVGQISVLEDLACRRVPIKYIKYEYDLKLLQVNYFYIIINQRAVISLFTS